MKDLSNALDKASTVLADNAQDADLSAQLKSMAKTLEVDGDDATANKRMSALGDTLTAIAARLR